MQPQGYPPRQAPTPGHVGEQIHPDVAAPFTVEDTQALRRVLACVEAEELKLPEGLGKGYLLGTADLIRDRLLGRWVGRAPDPTGRDSARRIIRLMDTEAATIGGAQGRFFQRLAERIRIRFFSEI